MLFSIFQMGLYIHSIRTWYHRVRVLHDEIVHLDLLHSRNCTRLQRMLISVPELLNPFSLYILLRRYSEFMIIRFYNIFQFTCILYRKLTGIEVLIQILGFLIITDVQYHFSTLPASFLLSVLQQTCGNHLLRINYELVTCITNTLLLTMIKYRKFLSNIYT